MTVSPGASGFVDGVAVLADDTTDLDEWHTYSRQWLETHRLPRRLLPRRIGYYGNKGW